VRRSAQPSWTFLSAAVRSGAKCVYCGTREDLVAHHKLPRRFGGPDLHENLEPVCRGCHPRIEQEATANAEQVWERPDPPERPGRRRAPRPLRPY
jgi:5-methylcytosine-specific restriction endonuclease McrA